MIMRIHFKSIQTLCVGLFFTPRTLLKVTSKVRQVITTNCLRKPVLDLIRFSRKEGQYVIMEGIVKIGRSVNI